MLGAAVLFTAAVAGVCAWALAPLPGTGSVQVTLPRGDSVREVAQTLQAHGLVRSAWAFQLYVVITGQAGRVQAGTYDVPRGQSVPELLALLVSGKALDRSAWVTIPEGYTVEQIADRLAAAGICSRQAFLDEVQHGEFTETIVQQLPQHAQVKYRLEGFLYPDTYRFNPHTPAHAVVDEMLQAFERNVDQPYGAVAKAEGRTLYDVVTEASMIEREARVDAERPLIASVIENRLNHQPPMKLQIDATVEYVLGHRDVLTLKDLQVQDPYNTYLHFGLPPGPIASPGIPSILAALHPAHTPYLYYVVKNDGSGEHYFAQTYAEQLHNEALSAANLKAHSQSARAN